MFICSTVLFINDEPCGYHLVKTEDGFALLPAGSSDKELPQLEVVVPSGDDITVNGTVDTDLIAQVQKLILQNKSGELEDAVLAAP